MHFEDARLKLLEQIGDEGVQTELWLAVIKLEMFVGEVNFSLQLEDLLADGALAYCSTTDNTIIRSTLQVTFPLGVCLSTSCVMRFGIPSAKKE